MGPLSTSMSSLSAACPGLESLVLSNTSSTKQSPSSLLFSNSQSFFHFFFLNPFYPRWNMLPPFSEGPRWYSAYWSRVHQRNGAELGEPDPGVLRQHQLQQRLQWVLLRGQWGQLFVKGQRTVTETGWMHLFWVTSSGKTPPVLLQESLVASVCLRRDFKLVVQKQILPVMETLMVKSCKYLVLLVCSEIVKINFYHGTKCTELVTFKPGGSLNYSVPCGGMDWFYNEWYDHKH